MESSWFIAMGNQKRTFTFGGKMSNKEIGKRIRELRELQNYTREGLAEKINISAKFLYEIEMGKKGFSARTLYKISRALSVSSDYIMLGKEQDGCGKEKIVCILEKLEPRQTDRIRDILKILYEMCDV